MIPIRDTLPHERTPIVNWAIIAVCCVVYAYQFALDLQPTGYFNVVRVRGRVHRVPVTQNEFFVNRWGAIPEVVLKGQITREETRQRFGLLERRAVRQAVPPRDRFLPLLTSLFLHGSLLHLLSNMLFLFVFGDNVEGRLGHLTYALFYLCGGVFASLSHVMFNIDSAIPIVGASGAISAVLGAYILLFPHSFVVTFVPLFFIPVMIHVPALVFIGLWFFTQITNGFGSLINTSGGIAWWAHIGGFVFGATVTFWNYPQWRRRRARYSSAVPM